MELRLIDLKNALESFDYLISVNLDQLRLTLDERLIDGLKNGMVQKFEYCIELTWKCTKKFLLEKDGIDAKTPKQTIKEFFLANYINETDYLKLFNALDDRNTLSHVYNQEEFEKILSNFSAYNKVMKLVYDRLTETL